MSSEKVVEFQKMVETDGGQVLGKRTYWKNFPEKIAANAAQALTIPENESVMMIVDATIMGSGKEGMVLTDWGVRYKSGVDSWSVSWSELSEKYIFEKKDDALLLQAKTGDDHTVTKEISMPMTNMDYDLLARLLSKTCQIFAEKSVDMVTPTISDVPVPDPNTFEFSWGNLSSNYLAVIVLKDDSITISRYKVYDKPKNQTPKGRPVTIPKAAIASIKQGRTFSPTILFGGITSGIGVGFGIIGGPITIIVFTLLGLLLAFPKKLVIIRKDGAKFKIRFEGSEDNIKNYERFVNEIFR